MSPRQGFIRCLAFSSGRVAGGPRLSFQVYRQIQSPSANMGRVTACHLVSRGCAPTRLLYPYEGALAGAACPLECAGPPPLVRGHHDQPWPTALLWTQQSHISTLTLIMAAFIKVTGSGRL